MDQQEKGALLASQHRRNDTEVHRILLAAGEVEVRCFSKELDAPICNDRAASGLYQGWLFLFFFLSPEIGVHHLFTCAYACSFDFRHYLAFHRMSSC